jgi:hypothetical protein
VTVKARDDADRHHAQQVRDQDEHEQREYVRRELLAFGADVRRHHVVDEAGETLDRRLPAAGHQFALQPAEHEQPQRAERDHHPQRAVGERNVVTTHHEMLAEQGFDQELVHRIDLARFGRHAVKAPAYAIRAPESLFRTLVGNPDDIPECDRDSEE